MPPKHRRRGNSCLIPLVVAILAPGQANAWGDLGHKVTALIAYRHLTPRAQTALDTLLASDPDPLTPPDFASRATWADKYRSTHRETAAWHFIDIEIDQRQGSITLSAKYRVQAQKDAATQLLKGAIRMATVLNGALGS